MKAYHIFCSYHLHVIERIRERDEGVFQLTNLGEASNAEVPTDIVIREISKPSHPHIGCNEHTDCIVYLCGSEVVVHQEKHLQELHILPFFFSV